jgi:hypothetical protein
MVDGRYYGSVKWAGGGKPMLLKVENRIMERVDNVSK